MMYRLLRTLTFTLSVALFFSSCAYFNTFHNTKKLYKEAAEERKKRREDKPTPTELRKYDETIAKASKILEVYSDSKYVDDALFILGECFYYKEDYIRAQRKFQELITFFPDSDYYQRARVWLARTNMELGDYTSTNLLLSQILESPKLKDDIRSESQLLLAQSLFNRKLYTEAEVEFRKAAENKGDEKIRAQAYFELGQCQIILDKFTEAVESFAKAVKNSPDKNFEFDARLKLADALKRARRFDEAKQICAELFDSDYYQDKHGFVKLERADCLYHEARALYEKSGWDRALYEQKLKEAIEAYELVTIEYKATEASATAYFRIADIYMNDLGAFALAQENFGKVASEYRKSLLIPEANRIQKDLNALVTLNNQVKKAQGEQLMSEATGRRPLTALELQLLEYGNHAEVQFLQRQGELSKQSPSDGKGDPDAGGVNKLVANKLQLAEVYLFQFGQVDSALQEYFEIAELFPENEASAKALYSAAYIYENEFHNKPVTDSLLAVLVERFPESVQARAVKARSGEALGVSRDQDANALYREAERRLFLWNQTELAIERYNDVIANYPESEYAPKALFAIGWIQEKMKSDYSSAADIYRRIQNEYPGSEYAAAVDQKLKALRAETEKAQAEALQPEIAESDSSAETVLAPQPAITDESKPIVPPQAELPPARPEPTPVLEDSTRLDPALKQNTERPIP